MNRAAATKTLLLAHFLSHSARAFSSARPWANDAGRCIQRLPITTGVQSSGGSRSSSSLGAGSGGEMPSIRQIRKEEMEQIIDDYENGNSNDYLVLDVRGEDEVMMTGKVSPNVITLPLPVIMAKNVFAMDEDDFEDHCGFEKPELDKTLVFTCAAGIRSQQAAFLAAQAGYGNLVNYMGGAKEWF